MNMLDAISYSNIDYINNAAGFLLNKVNPDGSIKFTNGQNANYYLINRTLEDFYPFKENPDVLTKINTMLGYLANNYDESTEILNNTDSLLDYAMTSYSFKLYQASSSKEAQLKETLLSQQNAEGLFAEEDHLISFAAMKALNQADLRIDSIASTGNFGKLRNGKFQCFIYQHRNSRTGSIRYSRILR